MFTVSLITDVLSPPVLTLPCLPCPVVSSAVIVKGKVKVTISNEVELINSPSQKAGLTNKVVEIAELIDNDIFGLIEYAAQSHTMTRSFVAIAPTEIFFIAMPLFASLMSTLRSTKEVINKIVEKRRYWEKLRLDYAVNFPSMKCTLPANAAKMSQCVQARAFLP